MVALLEEHLVVLAQRGAEDDARDALEAMDPLLALGALPADVEHVYSGHARGREPPARGCGHGAGGDVREGPEREARLGDAGALLACAQHVRLGRHVVGLADPQRLGEEAAGNTVSDGRTERGGGGGGTH